MRTTSSVATRASSRTEALAIEGVQIEERLDWASSVTPKLLASTPVHRWFVFPHSFSGELVGALLERWKVREGPVLDPFVGAGTTLAACQQAGLSSLGIDLSPLATLSSRVKTSPPHATDLRRAWLSIGPQLRVVRRLPSGASYDEVILRAFPGELLPTLDRAKRLILESGSGVQVSEALLLALLGVLPRFSRLVRKGGWLSVRQDSMQAGRLRRELGEAVHQMTGDIEAHRATDVRAEVRVADARQLPLEDESISSVITSPPYPNRHDYTRVFGVELQFAFLDWEETRQLRYQSFHSHPEAHPLRPTDGNYQEPAALADTISGIGNLITDNRAKTRIPSMLHGYFEDLYFALREMRRVLKQGANAALVLGNAQYCGLTVAVDRYAVEIGHQVGLSPESVIVTRHRGNSAQQMKKHGRHPQRESVVVFRKKA